MRAASSAPPNGHPAEPPVDAGPGYDAFFRLLKEARAWGLYAFQVKNGDVVKMTIERSFGDVHEALAALSDPASIDARLIRIPEYD